MTKANLTDYLAAKTLEYTNRESSKLIIMYASGYTNSTKFKKITMKKQTHC